MNWRASFTAVLLTLTCSVHAQPLPPGKLVAPTDLSVFYHGGDKSATSRTDVQVQGQSFSKAARITTSSAIQQGYGAQLATASTAAVQKGDVMLLTFWLRAAASRNEAGEAFVAAVFEEFGPPHAKSLSQKVAAGPQWKRFQMPFEAKSDYAAGKARLGFHCGWGDQAVEIAGIELLDFGKSIKIESLPRTRTLYAGHAPDAPWRKAAEQRIEKLRKGDLTIDVVDAAGKPLSGATVQVRMMRHAFPFGSAVAADALLGNKPENEKYRQEVKRLFNRVVLENDLKWGSFEKNRERSLKALDWLLQQGIEVRGHNLIWPSWKNTPRDLYNLKDNPEALRKRIDDHIRDIVSATKGKLMEWDVINETFTNHDVMDVLGEKEMVHWFKLAKESDPKPRLFLNDYPMLWPESPHFKHFEKHIQFLIDNGAPLGGIGVQCHYGGHLPGPQDLLAGLDRLAKFKLPIAMTEFDIDMVDELLQADYLRDHMIVGFSHEAVDSIIMWGFWEGRHWKPRAALYRKDWSIKPVGQAWEDLVLKQWWTTADMKTDASGKAAVRGFFGDYTVTAGGQTQKATLGRGGVVVKVTATKS